MSTSPPKILATRPMSTSILTTLAEGSKIDLVQWHDEVSHPDRSWVLDNAKGISGAVVMLADKVDKEFLDAAGKNLKVVSTMSVGFDHIDRDECKKRGIRVGYTPSVLSAAVSDLLLLLVLGITRQLPLATRTVREGKWGTTPWSPLGFCGPSLKGKTIAFLGFGDIAQTMTLRLLPFSPAKILYTTSSAKPLPSSGSLSIKSDGKAAGSFGVLQRGGFEELQDLYERTEGIRTEVENVEKLDEAAQRADVLIIMANLNAATHHIVDARLLQRMKKTAYLVNGARGPLVDTEALAEALKKGEIAGAALDVLEGEPNIPATHPLLDPSVADKVLLLPHIGSAATETRERMADVTANNVLAPLGLREEGMEFEVTL